jgi:hypothetical protein
MRIFLRKEGELEIRQLDCRTCYAEVKAFLLLLEELRLEFFTICLVLVSLNTLTC